jgi:hypothetical protein
MYHTKNPKSEPDLPEDSVYIYKDDRNYGKQSILKHNNGVHNYTLHEIDFVSKRVGKDLGITFNKEILMNGNNDLIIAIKSALMDSRSEFTADTHNGKNATLCEKAIKKGLINLQTCPEAKLSATHRSQRLCLNPPSVVSIKTPKPKKNNVVSKDDDSFSDLSETALVNTVEKSPTIINIVSVDTNVEQIEDKRLFDLLDIDPLDNESYPDGGVVKDIDKDVVEDVVKDIDEDIVKDVDKDVIEDIDKDIDKDVDKDVYKDIDEEVEILFDTDISNRRERTIAILDHLNNSLCGPDDCVLSVEILRVLESIFQ